MRWALVGVNVGIVALVIPRIRPCIHQSICGVRGPRESRGGATVAHRNPSLVHICLRVGGGLVAVVRLWLKGLRHLILVDIVVKNAVLNTAAFVWGLGSIHLTIGLALVDHHVVIILRLHHVVWHVVSHGLRWMHALVHLLGLKLVHGGGRESRILLL